MGPGRQTYAAPAVALRRRVRSLAAAREAGWRGGAAGAMAVRGVRSLAALLYEDWPATDPVDRDRAHDLVRAAVMWTEGELPSP
jgi:hypothetical protein